MKKELREKFDALDFVSKPEPNLYESCLGDDTDTLLGCSYLHHVSGIEVGGFFDFNNLYVSEERNPFKSFIGIDMSLVQKGFRTWDNHIQLYNSEEVVNNQCANINTFNGISRENYHEKYAGSTALQMFAYYDGKKPKTDEAAKLWIAVDVGYKAHYLPRFKQIHNNHLESLGLTWMIDILDKTNLSEMNTFLNHYGLNSKMKLKDGYLRNEGKWMKQQSGKWEQGNPVDKEFVKEHLGFDIVIPCNRFTLLHQMHRYSMDLSEINYTTLNRKDILSLAFTYQNKIEFTSLKKID